MRQTIKGLVAAIAVTAAGAAPAMACGFNPCGISYAPVQTYASGCGACGGGYERLAEPTTQYYYVNQGPTYSGPGEYAPEPTYQETAVPAWGGYGTGAYYGGGASYEGPAYYPYHHHYRPSYHAWHQAYRYGYMPHHYGHGYGYGYGNHYYGGHESYHYGHEGYYEGHRMVRRNY